MACYACQRLESARICLDGKLSAAEILPLHAPLSPRIDKIYTLLSTGFVDNAFSGRLRAPLEALQDAVFRGLATRA